MTYEEAASLLHGCRQYQDERQPEYILECMERRILSASSEDRLVMNQVIRDWMTSEDSKARGEGVWLTDALRIQENIDIIRQLMDEAEDRTDVSAPYDWAKFNRIVGRLIE